MEIKGMVYCMFEQSGTFKNEFIKLGYKAVDMDIQNHFNQTDYVIDLFQEIENAYKRERESIFDKITPDDLIIAFFPCIYFTGSSNPLFFCGTSGNYKGWTKCEIIDDIIDRSRKRQYFYELLLKFVKVCFERNLRMILENPYSTLHYLNNNFIQKPEFVDENRMLRGDYFVKPTGYWFFNCKATYGESFQYDKEQKVIRKCKGSKGDGLCSEERSMISTDYARNFICDFVIGKEQNFGQMKLF